MQKAMRTLVLACVFSFSLQLAMAQQPAVPAQQSAAAVAEPEAPRVVLQAETTASVLRLMKFSGLLRDRAGNPRTGAVGLTFALYKDQQGGSPLWLEVHNAQLDDQGRYTVLLGSTKSEGLPLELFSSGEARWLGVQVNLPGEEEQSRVLLVSVPYALKAADAETLGGKPPSAFLLADPVGADPRVRPEAGKAEPAKEAVKEGPGREQVVGTITGEGVPGFVAKFTGANTIGSGSIFDNGNVGIATTNPNAKLSVGNGTIPDSNVPVQISTAGPGSITYYGANKNGGYGALFGYENSGSLATGGVVRVVTSDPLMFFVNNNLEAIRIDNTGRVGVGTGTPQAKLSVGPGSVADTNVPVQISTVGPGSLAYYGVNKNGGYGVLFGYENSGALATGGVVRVVTTDPLLLFVNNTLEAVRINSNGNMGIGTTTPSQKLEVGGNVKVGGIVFPSGIVFTDFTLQTTAGVAKSGDTMSGALVLPANGLTAGTTQLVLSGGNVGIGTATPANILTVMQSSATDPIADAWTMYSSRRWKTNIRPLQGALEKVQGLRGVSYDRKADGRHDIGLIAEEVGKVVPEVVAYEENGQDAKSVDYARLTALLIEAVKEQQAQIRQLQLQVEQLQGRGRKAANFRIEN